MASEVHRNQGKGRRHMSESEFADFMRIQNEDRLRAVQEKPAEMEGRVGRAPLRCAQTAAAVMEAVVSSKPKMIRSAWNATHLFPYYGTPNYAEDKEKVLFCCNFRRRIGSSC